MHPKIEEMLRAAQNRLQRPVSEASHLKRGPEQIWTQPSMLRENFTLLFLTLNPFRTVYSTTAL